MSWQKVFPPLLVFLTQYVCHCTNEVQYSYKLLGQHAGDLFGINLATAPGKLIISVPGDKGGRGSLAVGHKGHQVFGPANKHGFGWNLDTNDRFMVVTAGHSAPVLVYQATHSFKLLASIPLDGAYLLDVVIGNDSTIALAWIKGSDHYVSIYHYDGQSIWDRAQKLTLEHCSAFSSFPRKLLALSGGMLVVGLPDVGQGHVQVYRQIKDVWQNKQRLRPGGKVSGFGWSIAVDGDHLAVSSNQVVFTYNLDHRTGSWTSNGQLRPAGLDSVAIQNGILVISITEKKKRSELCGIAYKLS